MKRFISLILVIAVMSGIYIMPASASSSGTVTASSLNMRKKATTDSAIVTVLKKNAKVTINGTYGSWYKVSYNGKSGYVMKNYVKKGSSSSSGSSSSKGSSSSSSVLQKGSSSSKVRDLQKKLKELGYYSGSIDGDYGNGTLNAVKKFQRDHKLTADGVAGSKTLSAIKNAKKGSSSGSSSSSTEKLDWFNGGSRKIPKGAVFQVKDCKTGKIFTCKRWSGGSHIDAEPKTANDTRIMKSIYGHWSWRRRPVLVKYNGHVYAGSMNGMPHGTQTISNNNFDGHFCIHFTGSKTHGSKKVDAMHQNCVKEALKYHW